jgi:hypothetical protein
MNYAINCNVREIYPGDFAIVTDFVVDVAGIFQESGGFAESKSSYPSRFGFKLVRKWHAPSF